MGYEKPMDSLRDNQNSKDALSKRLNFQESVRPKIMDNYTIAMKDFVDRVDALEKIENIHFDSIPDEFRIYMKTIQNNEIFGNGSVSLSSIKIRDFGNEGSPDYNFIKSDEFKIIKEVSVKLHDKYGFPTTYDHILNKDKEGDGKYMSTYIICLPGGVVQNENGKWVPKEIQAGSAKFFAMMTVLGLADEKFILEDGISTLGVKGINFNKDYTNELINLRKDGYKNIVDANTENR